MNFWIYRYHTGFFFRLKRPLKLFLIWRNYYFLRQIQISINMFELRKTKKHINLSFNASFWHDVDILVKIPTVAPVHVFVFIFRELHALKVNTVARFEGPVVNTRHMERVSALDVMGCHSSLASSKDGCRVMSWYNSTIVPLHHRRWEPIHLAYELASDSEVLRRHDKYKNSQSQHWNVKWDLFLHILEMLLLVVKFKNIFSF